MSDNTITLNLDANNLRAQLRKIAATLGIPIVYIGHRELLVNNAGIGTAYGLPGMGKTSGKAD